MNPHTTRESTMKHPIIAIALLASAGAAQAFGGNENQYNTQGNGYQAYNPGTGSTWNSQSNGKMQSGTDSRGNAWQYNGATGQYYNYGTGETRYRGSRTN